MDGIFCTGTQISVVFLARFEKIPNILLFMLLIMFSLLNRVSKFFFFSLSNFVFHLKLFDWIFFQYFELLVIFFLFHNLYVFIFWFIQFLLLFAG